MRRTSLGLATSAAIGAGLLLAAGALAVAAPPDPPAAVAPATGTDAASGMPQNPHPGQADTVSGTRTTIGTVNVRSGPGTGFEVARTLPDATSVEVAGCANAWCRVEGGYVSLYVLSQGPVRQVLGAGAQPRLPVAAAPNATAPAPGRNAVTAAAVQLHSGPANGAPVLGSLPAGFPVAVQSCAGGWCRTQYGYVNARSLRQGIGAAPAAAGPGADPANSATQNTHPGQTDTMSGTRTTIGTVNIRSGPGTDFEVVRTLPDATSVEVAGCANAWCRIEGGYVSLYVLSQGPVRQVLGAGAQPRLPLPPPANAPAAGTAVTTANVDVRSGPGSRYASLGPLPAGFPVEVQSCAGGWCRTQYGYVNARLVSRGPGAARPAALGPRSEAPAAGPAPRARRAAAPRRGPGYWGPDDSGPNRPSSWGARPGHWGGRPTYWSAQPGYLVLVAGRDGTSRRRPAAWTYGRQPDGQGPYALATFTGRPLLWQPTLR